MSIFDPNIKYVMFTLLDYMSWTIQKYTMQYRHEKAEHILHMYAKCMCRDKDRLLHIIHFNHVFYYKYQTA